MELVVFVEFYELCILIRFFHKKMFQACFSSIFSLSLWRAYYKALWRFDQFLRSYETKKFWIRRKWHDTHECTKHFTPGFLYPFVVNFKGMEISTKFYGVLDHFSRTYEVAKFWMIKIYRCKWRHPRYWTYILRWLYV